MTTTRSSALKQADETQGLVMDLVNSSDAMLAYWDQDQICRFANKAYLQWFGVDPDELIGMTMEKLLGPLYAKNLPHIKAAFAGQPQVFEREITAPGGRVRYSLARYIPRIVDGTVRGIFVHVADVSILKKLQIELQAAKDEAERLATHDVLTGLPNRLLLIDRIHQALILSKRTGRLVAGMALDLDDFKRVNDTYGHDTGDRLLIEVAIRLQSAIRKHDSVTRIGGDEFFILAPDMSTRFQAEIVAAHLMHAINAPLRVGSIEIDPSCSIGIALSSPHVVTPEALIKASDHALYEAKRLGKNRFYISQLGSHPFAA